jgi:hypothetical protein
MSIIFVDAIGYLQIVGHRGSVTRTVVTICCLSKLDPTEKVRFLLFTWPGQAYTAVYIAA